MKWWLARRAVRRGESAGRRGRRWPVPRILTMSLCLSVVLPATLVFADARVDVEVKDAVGRLASGEVTLSAGAITRSCRTVGGRCSITIAAGRYQARLVPAQGTPSTSQITVPASGSVRLVMQVTPATAVPTPPPPSSPSVTTPAASTNTAPKASGTLNTAAPTNQARPRNLGIGRRVVIQGSIYDAAGRLANAEVTVQSKRKVVGQVRSVAGRFSIFDLPQGVYTLLATGSDGSRARVTLTIKAVLLRPTLRLMR